MKLVTKSQKWPGTLFPPRSRMLQMVCYSNFHFANFSRRFVCVLGEESSIVTDTIKVTAKKTTKQEMSCGGDIGSSITFPQQVKDSFTKTDSVNCVTSESVLYHFHLFRNVFVFLEFLTTFSNQPQPYKANKLPSPILSVLKLVQLHKQTMLQHQPPPTQRQTLL